MLFIILIIGCADEKKVCNEMSIPPWHNSNELGIEGGSKKIREIFSEIQRTENKINPQNGFITLKIHINSEGELCNVESFQINQDYKAIVFNDNDLINRLEKKAREILIWQNKLKVQSFYLIRFKMIEGRIDEIF